MSGVMALLSLNGRPIPPELVRAQLAAIAHRGESPPRAWEAPGIALGHANLPRTPEAERELLPTSDATGRYWITWDGRLDNREELDRLLAIDRGQAAAMTDADYVLAAYRAWGPGCVSHLLGDWAMVIWDNHKRRLFIAKDPVGYRQLFHRTVDGLLLVGSEPMQLFAGTPGRPAPDREYTMRYLAGAMQDEARNWLEGVSNVHGGERIIVDADGLRSERYWTQPRVTPRPYKRPQEYVDEFVATFDAAVKARLRSNRPIGIYLSGGVDSSYVAAVASKLGSHLVAINSYDPHGEKLDERRYARLVANHLGIDLHELDAGDCWTLSSKWLDQQAFDAPFVPGQGAHHTRIGQLIGQMGAGVVLGGEGGDEWCNGPERYLATTVARGRARTAWHLARINRSRRGAARVLGKQVYRGLAPHAVQALLDRSRNKRSPDPFPSTVPLAPAWEDIVWHKQRASEWSIARAQRVDWDVYRQINWLEPSWRDRHEVHKAGVERRPPFFDLRVIELMASTPPWVLRFRGRKKDVLREAEYPVLPHEIPDRMDWCLFDDLFFRGMNEERERVQLAGEHLRAFLGLDHNPIQSLTTGQSERLIRWPTWRAVSTGLWLSTLCAPELAESNPLSLSSV
ncbi:MAG: asparagine synthase-related protein [Dehalococcoidia bacterium]|nr:asparagine synthase-related protein [Dehalococcoidia bacterium]